MTMTTTTQHPVAPEELMAYLDGELSPDRAAETASHLESCKECQTLVADLGGVSQKLIEWRIEAPEPILSQRLAEELHRRQEGKVGGLVSGRKAQMSFLSGRGLLLAGGLAAIIVIMIAIFTPNLLRSRKAAEESARAARQRHQQAVANLSPGPDRYAPKAARSRVAGGLDLYATDGEIDVNGNGVGSIGKLQTNQLESEKSQVAAINGPMIVRTAELSLTTKEFDHARATVEEILKRHKGYVGELNVNTSSGSARSLRGELRLPASQLDAALADFKVLGRVEGESQSGEEVTQKYVDLEARLANSKHTEQRLSDMLLNRTGKLSDVLAVEMQISRVRGEIEQMEAERKQLKNQVDYATLTITVNEDYKAELKVVPPSTSTQIRNAAVEGYRNLVDGLLGVFLWLLSVLPALLVWCGLLFFPARYAWKKLRPRFGREIGSP
jgi:hypothetical protein